MNHPLRKVVIPAAGLGTRFLPATKAVPKEMLPIVDVPTIQLIVEEAVQAGVQQVVVVNGRAKGSIEDHFDRSYELEDTLQKKGKRELFEQVRRISEMVRLISVRQKEPMGLGHAVLALASSPPWPRSSTVLSALSNPWSASISVKPWLTYIPSVSETILAAVGSRSSR